MKYDHASNFDEDKSNGIFVSNFYFNSFNSNNIKESQEDCYFLLRRSEFKLHIVAWLQFDQPYFTIKASLKECLLFLR